MHFWIDIEFTKTLGQFKEKKFVYLFMTFDFKLFFYLLNPTVKKKCLIVKILLFRGQGDNEVLLTWSK
jgi:hypothetical protein